MDISNVRNDNQHVKDSFMVKWVSKIYNERYSHSK